jgi:hypothetical protein
MKAGGVSLLSLKTMCTNGDTGESLRAVLRASTVPHASKLPAELLHTLNGHTEALRSPSVTLGECLRAFKVAMLPRSVSRLRFLPQEAGDRVSWSISLGAKSAPKGVFAKVCLRFAIFAKKLLTNCRLFPGFLGGLKSFFR